MKNIFFLILLLLLSEMRLNITAQVDTAWTRSFGGTSQGEDVVTALDVDRLGNAYVTGSCADIDGEKIATIKYSSSGEVCWIAKFHPSIYGNRRAYGIAVDESLNVYVTGSSCSPPWPSTYLTIKYDSNGQEKWFKYYGPFSGEAKAITLDKQGNVYTTGFCTIDVLGKDYITIKYNSSGEQQWVARYTNSVYGYDFAKSISVDDFGNVYVTGTSYDSTTYYDIVTVKYNSLGQQQWVHRYDDPDLFQSYNDCAYAISVDRLGDIVVTGGVRGFGNFGLPPESYSDCITIKYNSYGDILWVNKYDHGYHHDWGIDLALDTMNNIFIAGIAADPGGADYLTLKYNADGQLIWDKFFTGLYYSEDHAKCMVLDKSGNVYLSGRSGVLGIYWNFATVKYNSNGEEQWSIRYGDSNYPTYHQAIAIGVDEQNNVIVTGQTRGDNRCLDYLTFKYVQDSISAMFYEQITPTEYNLLQNYPNPFNPSTKITWQSPVGSWQTIKLFDVLGNQIATLVDEYKPAGRYEVEFNVAQDSRPAIASGVYFYQLRAGEFIQTKKMILIR